MGLQQWDDLDPREATILLNLSPYPKTSWELGTEFELSTGAINRVIRDLTNRGWPIEGTPKEGWTMSLRNAPEAMTEVLEAWDATVYG